MRSFHTVRNACLLNTRSTIHNKLREKKLILIQMYIDTTLKGDIAKKSIYFCCFGPS